MIARAKRFSIPPRPQSVQSEPWWDCGEGDDCIQGMPLLVTELGDPESNASLVLFGVCVVGFVLLMAIAWVLS